MKMKKLWALLCVAALSASVVGCGSQAPAEAEVQPTVAEEAAEEVVEEEPEEATEEEVVEEDVNAVGKNRIKNGDFSDGTEGWGTYLNSGGYCDFVEQDGQGVATISKTGATNYGVQIFYDGFKLDQGGVYEFSYDISSTIERDFESRIQINGSDYHAYFMDNVHINSEMQHVSFEFTMTEETDVAPRLCFNLGIPEGVSSLDAHTVVIDNVSVVLIDDTNVIYTEIVDRTKNVNVNQVGFLPNARKTAVVRSEGIDKTFDLVDESGKVVYSGSLTGPVDAQYAEESVLQADFSDFTTPGTYKVVVSNGDDSYPFTIGAGIYDELLEDSILMLTRQRCGMALDASLMGELAHPECHMGDAVVYGTNQKVEVTGGWHDAGDYGRYVVAGVTAVEDLLLTYRDYPEMWSRDDLGIPESGNGVPDILDEAKYELDWLLKMQDPATGGVYHKVTCLEFPQFVMPEEETDELILSPISNTATGDFAAVMAQASTIYADIDPDFSKKALAGAKKAYAYLEDHKSSPSFSNPEEIVTGEYPDGQFKDEMYWASIELYKVTSDAKYLAYAEDILDQFVLHGYGWAGMGTYGNIAYLSLTEGQKPELASKIREEVLKKADEYLANSQTDGYMVDLGKNYCWGSNMVVCGNARQMLLSASENNDSKYDQAVYDQLSYLLGQNAVSYCFVTGYGSLSAENTHHRPSIAKGVEMKGMLVGGPDGNYEDSFIKGTMMGTPPAKCYADSAQSYSTNEVTIYWNSPFVYLLSAIIDKNK